jgi:SAM-dependent methyltransferase
VIGYEAWERRARLWVPTLQRNVTTRLDVLRYLSMLPDAVRGLGHRYGDSLFRADWGWVKMSLRPYLSAVADLDLTPPRSILDLGCGDGLVTCFYAVLFPTAEVVAVDQCGVCLITTQTLASRLGLRNLRILQVDASQEGMFSGWQFDLVVARSLVLHRLLHGEPRGSEGDEYGVPLLTDILRTSRHVLRPGDGMLISTERWDRATDLWYWTSTIASAGFDIDWVTCRSIAPTTRALSRWRSFMVVARASETPTTVQPSDVLSFLANVEALSQSQRPILTGYTAESLFRTLGRRELVFVFEATRAGFMLRRELHHVGTLLVSYDYTNWHERELSFWPRWAAEALEAQLRGEADALHGHGWDVLRFLPDTRPDDQVATAVR